MKITVVLPAYNEAGNLPDLLDRITSVLTDSPHDDYQIIVVDDGSTDETASIVSGAAQRHPIVLHRHDKNRGLGAALRTGLVEASKSDGIIITMDADNSHDPANIPDLIAAIEKGHDVVIASRFQEGGAMIGVPAHRRILSIGASSLMKLVFPHDAIRDYSTGYRAYHSSTVRNLRAAYGPDLVTQPGFAAMVEILLKVRAEGAIIGEIPFVLRYDRKQGPSKMAISRTILGYLQLVTSFYTADFFRGQRRPVESS